MSALKLVVTGAGGRMGQTLIREIAARTDCVLAGASERPGVAAIGQDAGTIAGLKPLGIPVTDDPLPLFAKAEAVIDFTSPAASVAHAGFAAQARITHVLGTTGLASADDEKILAAARHAAIVRSGNFSLGVNLLAALTQKAASILGDAFDIEILEMHHRGKVDAPSGTALLLGKAAAEGRAIGFEESAVFARQGLTGPRKAGTVGFASLRGGSVVGEHSVIFAADHERVMLTHVAEDRAIFARGALYAALWARGKKPGLYTMADVLKLD